MLQGLIILGVFKANLCTSQIASTESSLREEALAELRTSARVALVLPFLLQFIDVRLRDNVLLSANVVQLLIAYKSILENQSIYLDPFIPNLVPGPFYS